MLLDLSLHSRSVIQHEAHKTSNEICGFVIERSGRETIHLARNASPRPKEHFLIAPSDERFALSLGKILAYFHSHPDSDENPSEEDIIICNKTGIPSIVYSVKTKKFSITDSVDDELPLLNRPFIVGVSDCIQLVKDYYSQKLNIELKSDAEFDFRYSVFFEEPFWKSSKNVAKNKNAMPEYFKTMGFGYTDKVKKNSLLFFASSGMVGPDHVCVYVGNGMMLDQPMSTRSKYKNVKNLSKTGKLEKTAFAIMDL